jgi:hypothetical protein
MTNRNRWNEYPHRVRSNRNPLASKVSAAVCLAALALLLAPSQAHAQDLATLGITIPKIGSGSPAFRLNTETAVFERAPDSLGPVLAEGARTVGKRQLYVSFLYTHLDIKEIEGAPIDDFFLSDFTVDILDFVFEYGLTDVLEVSLDIPFRGVTVEEAPDVGGATLVDGFGIGDVRLRAKYHLFKTTGLLPQVAIQTAISFPSGDEAKLRGTGETHFIETLILSGTYWNDLLTPHFNLDIEMTTSLPAAQTDLGFNKRELWNVQWVLGTDFHVPLPEALDLPLNLSLDFLGRHKLYDDTGFGGKIYDVGIGAKVNPFSSFGAFLAVIIPLNDEGLRPDAIVRVGGEMTFF